jgi:hypothetical protein
MLLHSIPDSAPTRTKPAPVALYLDCYLSSASVNHVVDLCQKIGTTLVMLAPPSHSLAVSRLEPYLGVLDRAGIEWEILAVASDPDVALRDLLEQRPGVASLVCDSRSSLADHFHAEIAGSRGKPPVALHVVLVPERSRGRSGADDTRAVNWLEPRFNRGF